MIVDKRERKSGGGKRGDGVDGLGDFRIPSRQYRYHGSAVKLVMVTLIGGGVECNYSALPRDAGKIKNVEDMPAHLKAHEC